ncbi:MAG: hypothetical protein IKI49_00605 [Oscillospiraceae bacterium]|nr:hypothetical protein [Oscillospiraceae bacterium]
MYKKLTAVTVGDTKYTVADYNYFKGLMRSEIYSQFGGADAAKSYVTDDMIEGAALNRMQYATAYADLAREAGYSLSEDGKAAVDSNVELQSMYASISKVSLNKYLSSGFGFGVDEDVFRRNMELVTLMNEYGSKLYKDLEYSDAELEEKYDPAKDDVLAYYLFSVNNSDQENEETAADDAKAVAEEFASKVTDAASFEALTYEYAPETSKIYYKQDPKTSLNHTSASALSETYSEWLLDSARKAGDVEVFSDDNGAYVVYFVERSDNKYTPVSVRQIFFPHGVTYSDYLSDKEYEDAYAAAIEDAHGSAEEALNTWKDGEMTEDAFAYLAQTYNANDNSGGLVSVMQKGAYNEAVEKWCFDSARKEGDTAVIDTPQGSYVLYFIEEYSQNYRQYIADSALRSEEFNAMEQEAIVPYTVKKAFGFRFAS